MQIDYIKIVNMTYLLASSDKISTKTLQDKTCFAQLRRVLNLVPDLNKILH